MTQLKHKDVWTGDRNLYTDKEDTSLPTVSIEAIIFSCTTDEKENVFVVISNILMQV